MDKVDSGDQEAAIQGLAANTKLVQARTSAETAVSQLITINDQEASNGVENAKNVAKTTQTVTIALGVAITLLSIGLGILITLTITVSLKSVMLGAHALAEGNLMRDVTSNTRGTIARRKDEVGEIARAFERMFAYLQEMADVAGQIAQGNLAVTIIPKSEKDELGNAFASMTDSLRQTIGQVTASAAQVNDASSQLVSAAGQAGQATTQIATTMQQVAKGAGQQSEASTITAASMEKMGKSGGWGSPRSTGTGNDCGTGQKTPWTR